MINMGNNLQTNQTNNFNNLQNNQNVLQKEINKNKETLNTHFGLVSKNIEDIKTNSADIEKLTADIEKLASPAEPSPEWFLATKFPMTSSLDVAVQLGFNNAPDSTLVYGGNVVRQLMQLGASGSKLRITFSNIHGASDLPVEASIAHSFFGTTYIHPSVMLTFDGAASGTIPAGGTLTSDPVDFVCERSDIISVSCKFTPEDPAITVSFHDLKFNPTFVQTGGNVSDISMVGATDINNVINISSIEVYGIKPTRSIALYGDSLTDGYITDPISNGCLFWQTNQTNILRDRMMALTDDVVLDCGISGNKLSTDDYIGSGNNWVGIPLRQRIESVDESVTDVVIWIGINDLGVDFAFKGSTDVSEYKKDLQDSVNILNDKGMNVYIGTLTPAVGFRFGSYNIIDPQRREVNDFINNTLTGAQVLDFETLLTEAYVLGTITATTDANGNPFQGAVSEIPDFDNFESNLTTILQPQYNSGDFLHFSVAAYELIAKLVMSAIKY